MHSWPTSAPTICTIHLLPRWSDVLTLATFTLSVWIDPSEVPNSHCRLLLITEALYRNLPSTFKWCLVYYELCKVSLLTHILKYLKNDWLISCLTSLSHLQSLRKLWKVAEVTPPSILPLINYGSMNHSPWTPPTTMASSGLTMEGAVYSMVRVRRKDSAIMLVTSVNDKSVMWQNHQPLDMVILVSINFCYAIH